jgi:hypothetical protein
VLIVLLGSSVVAGLITSVLTGLRAAATERREGYAGAVRTLIARVEYSYRVRRRVSDAPETLAALTERGHDLQEQLAACRTWVAAEHPAVGKVYEQVLASIDSAVNPCTSKAWTLSPITNPADMNLAGWGPGDQWREIAKLQTVIGYRFGWRRLLPAASWRSG